MRGEYAVLPAGIAWDDWSAEERAELDDYVRHLMHSRRERFRRRLRGFGQFVSRRKYPFLWSMEPVRGHLGGVGRERAGLNLREPGSALLGLPCGRGIYWMEGRCG